MQKLMLIYLSSRSDCKIISELSINNPTVLLSNQTSDLFIN